MTATAPLVSIIIPAYYSYETVRACLEALRLQTFRDFETILVNSSPETKTGEIVTTQFPEVRFVQSSTRLLPHAARNHGVTLARGELLVFTDPDCESQPDWLERLVNAYEQGHPVVGGSNEPGAKNWFEYGAHLCKFSWLLSGLNAGPRWILPSANVGYAHSVWKVIGPLEEAGFCGDALQSWRAAAKGFTPWFEPKAVVKHRHEGNLRSLWRERVVRGYEFGQLRMTFEHWPRWRAALYIVLFPMLVTLVLLRAGRDTVKSGLGLVFLWTLPVQWVGQTAWCLGELRAQLQYALNGTDRKHQL
jgi:GT2 family glycosyltransferase